MNDIPGEAGLEIVHIFGDYSLNDFSENDFRQTHTHHAMTYLALILPVLLGYLLVKLTPPSAKVLQLFLSFSGAYLLSMTVLHLIPEVFIEGDPKIGLFILLGIAVQTGLEHLSKRRRTRTSSLARLSENHPLVVVAEFGRTRVSGRNAAWESSKTSQLLAAIIIHKLPIAFILATFLVRSSLPSRLTSC